MNKKHGLIIFLLFFVSLLYPAQKVLKLETDKQEIYENEALELSIILENFDGNEAELTPPDLEKNFTIAYGPATSHSTSIINGVFRKNISVRYQLLPKKTGSIKIGPVVVTENSQTYKSNTLVIKVLKLSQAKKTTGPKMFIAPLVSQKNPFVGQLISLEYGLYLEKTIKHIPSIISEPKLKGFEKEDCKINNRRLVQKKYQGQNYYYLPLKKYNITPTKSGKIEIDPLIISVPIEKKNSRSRRNQIFNDPFFDDDIFASRTTDVPVKSSPLKLTIKALPKNKPKSFNGAVGEYSFSINTPEKKAKTNEAITLKYTIRGEGNPETISGISLNISGDFEIYEASRKVNREAGAKNATVSFDQVLIPRLPGKQTIKNIKFTYFSPKQKKYITIEKPDIVIEVDGSQTAFGNNNSAYGTTKKQVELIRSDIRYIKNDIGSLSKLKDLKLKFSNFYIFFIASLSLLALSLLIKFIIISNEENQQLIRQRNAFKNAINQANRAKKILKKDQREFYKELNLALMSFFADKYNRSANGLLLEDIEKWLLEYENGRELFQELKEFIDNSNLNIFTSASIKTEKCLTDFNSAKSLLARFNKLKIKQEGQ